MRSKDATGLADVELLVTDQVLDAVRSRSSEGGDTDSITLSDPWGTSITLRSA